jgi:hypothetical protein
VALSAIFPFVFEVIVILSRFNFPPKMESFLYYTNLFYEVLLCQSYILIFTLLNDGKDRDVFYWIFSLFFLFPTLVIISKWRNKKTLINNIKTPQTANQVFSYFIMFLGGTYDVSFSCHSAKHWYILFNEFFLENIESYGFFCALVSVHMKNCENENCSCLLLSYELCNSGKSTKIIKKTKKKVKTYGLAMYFEHESCLPNNLKYCFKETLIHCFFKDLFISLIFKYPKCLKLSMLKSYFDYHWRVNPLNALQTLKQMEKIKPSISFQFQIFHHRFKNND